MSKLPLLYFLIVKSLFLWIVVKDTLFVINLVAISETKRVLLIGSDWFDDFI